MNRLLDAKRNIILHFAERSSWTNLFDDSVISNPARRSTTTTVGSITVTNSRDEHYVRLAYEPRKSSVQDAVTNWILAPANSNASNNKPSFLEIMKDGEALIIRDESDRVFSLLRTGEQAQQGDFNVEGVESLPIDDARHQFDQSTVQAIDIPSLDATMFFAEDGRKSILFSHDQTAYVFDRPTGYSQMPAVFTKFLNRVSFDQEYALPLGLNLRQEFLTPAKLFVAVDLGVEPDIKVFNKIDENRGIELLAYLIERRNEGLPTDSAEADYDIGKLQQAWGDSVDFEGYFIAVARQFGITFQSAPDQYHFDFSADSKEFLMAQGMVLNGVIEAGLQPAPVLQKNPTLQNLMHVLDQNGELISGHAEKDMKWRTIVLQSSKAGAMARQVRQMFIDHYGNDFSRNYVSSVRFDENCYLLSVREDAYSSAKAVLDASLQAMSLVRNGSEDISYFRELLERGASLRYVDPENAQKGEAFSSLLRKSENYKLLEVLKDIQGSADIELSGLDYSS